MVEGSAQDQGLLILRYEDLRADQEATLKGLLEFLGTPATEAQIADAVAFASLDNMKQMERQRVFWLSGGRLVPKDRANPNSYKVRAARPAAIAMTSMPPSSCRSTAWSRPRSIRATVTPGRRAAPTRSRRPPLSRFPPPDPRPTGASRAATRELGPAATFA